MIIIVITWLSEAGAWGANIRIRHYRTSKNMKHFVQFLKLEVIMWEKGVLIILALSYDNKHATKRNVEEAVGLLDSLFAVHGIKTLLFYVVKNALLILSDSRSARAGSIYRRINAVTDSKRGKGISNSPKLPHSTNVAYVCFISIETMP